MNKAFVDTTVLTNVLLKTGDIKNKAKQALSRFNISELPVYAIKEFKRGPLSYYKYIHNELATTRSMGKTLSKLQKLSATPQKYRLSTSLEALAVSANSIANKTLSSLVDKYGKDAIHDVVIADEYRILIKNIIYKAWKNRRKVTTHTVHPLSCYFETPPRNERGLIVLNDTSCDQDSDCCMNEFLKSKKHELKALVSVIDTLDQKPENRRRRKVLKDLARTPKRNIRNKECCDLGDAVFALYAASDSIILTTNTKDYLPLANALSKKVESI